MTATIVAMPSDRLSFATARRARVATTLWELLAVLQEVADTDREVVLTARHMLCAARVPVAAPRLESLAAAA